MGEMLSYIVENMATKEDIADVRRDMATRDELAAARDELRAEMREGFASIREELRDIRRVVENLQTPVGNTEGYSKEIDHALARIARIEKHLGIEAQLAA